MNDHGPGMIDIVENGAIASHPSRLCCITQLHVLVSDRAVFPALYCTLVYEVADSALKEMVQEKVVPTG